MSVFVTAPRLQQCDCFGHSAVTVSAVYTVTVTATELSTFINRALTAGYALKALRRQVACDYELC